MKGRFTIDEPGELPVTLTLTATMDEWRQLRDQMQREKWPACDVCSIITEVVHEAGKTFRSEGECRT